MRTVLDKQDIKIAYAAATAEETRAALHCVRIGEGKITACDGFILAERPLKIEPEDAEPILVNAACLLKAQEVLGNGRILLEASKERVSLRREDGKTLEAVIFAPFNEVYPSLEAIIPTKERKAFVGLSPFYIRKLLKMIDTSEFNSLKFKLREASDPVEVLSNKTRIFVMPMYTTED